MPANLIKLTINGSILEFSPDKVGVIQLEPGSSTVSIGLTTGRTVDLVTPSPADALVKLGQLETAMSTGTGIVSINDQNSAVTPTTTAAPSGSSGPGASV